MYNLKSGDSVLVLWQDVSEKELLDFVSKLRSVVTELGSVQLENISFFNQTTLKDSIFDAALFGFIGLSNISSVKDCFHQLIRVLKPNGQLILKSQPVDSSLESLLKFAGFVNTEKISDGVFSTRKPSYEIGSAIPLKKSAPKKVDNNVAKVWTLSASDTTDDGIIDSDILLSSDDWQKPDLAAIKADCGTGKGAAKKACKNCTCGLAQQLEAEAQAAVQPVKSSCGSCYLGDAFRCSGCPYRGLPAFKPGEVVSLQQSQMQ